MGIKNVIWSSMLDYPNQTSTTLFVGVCNLRCEYCHNLPLLQMNDLNFENYILPKLISRKSMIDHVVISGGECLFDKNFEYYISRLKENKFKIGVHTNGMNYEVLKNNIKNIDFVGMDKKTVLKKYSLITENKKWINNIEKS